MGKDDDKASVGGESSLDFNFVDEPKRRWRRERLNQRKMKLQHWSPSLFMNTAHRLPDSSSPGKIEAVMTQKHLTESSRKRLIGSATRVPLLRIQPEEEWEVHHHDRENRTGRGMDRVAFMEEILTVVQCYGNHFLLKAGLNRPMMQEILDKLNRCEGRMSEGLLIDSATDESGIISPIKLTHQESNNELLCLSRMRRGTRRPKLVVGEIKGALECYLEKFTKGTTMKQNAFGTLASSEMHTETVDQNVSLPWRAVILRHFKKNANYFKQTSSDSDTVRRK